MRVIITESADHVAHIAADFVCETLTPGQDRVLGLATGSTPVRLYGELVQRHHAGAVSFARASSFNLDEYVGLAPEHPQSYRAFMNRELFDHVDIDPSRAHVPDGLADPADEARRYEQAISDAGGIDLQVLGIGRNGHIGFNEPTSSLASRTRLKTLAPSTIEANSRFFAPGETPPRLAITMGIGTILEARRVLLLATGRAKAPAVRNAVEGPLSAMVPASALQWHNDAVILVDRDAASLLQQIEYYEHVESEARRFAAEQCHG